LQDNESAALSEMLNSMTVAFKTLTQIQVEQRKLQDRLLSLQDKVKRLDGNSLAETLLLVILISIVVLTLYQFYAKRRTRRRASALY